MVITPSRRKTTFNPSTKSSISGTWARTLLPMSKFAFFLRWLNRWANSVVKYSVIVGIPFRLATLAVFLVGSIPNTGTPLFLKCCNKYPSFDAISITCEFSLYPNRSTMFSTYCRACSTQLFEYDEK